jgi:hypothetical protein
MHDARWRLAAGRERHGEAEAETLRQGRSDRATLGHRRFIGARVHEGVEAKQGVAWHGAPGGIKALIGGPRRGIEEPDRWDPVAENYRIKNTSERK